MAKGIDVLRLHAEAITDRETKAIFYWGLGTRLGDDVGALKAWALNTLSEHLRAIVDPDPAKRTADEAQLLALLDEKADAFNAELEKKLGEGQYGYTGRGVPDWRDGHEGRSL